MYIVGEPTAPFIRSILWFYGGLQHKHPVTDIAIRLQPTHGSIQLESSVAAQQAVKGLRISHRHTFIESFRALIVEVHG